jgi:DegV family protein with EDD domain
MKIGIVSDSTADIPAALAEQYGIEVVPAQVAIGGESFFDGIEISREDFYDRLPNLAPPPTTASPSVGSFQERYEKLLRTGADFIVSIHPPNELSGIFNAARLAAEAFGQRVKVLDGGQVSLGLGFQAIMAAEAAKRDASLDEIITLVESIRARVRLVALLDTIEYIRRSGRVSWAKARISELLHLRLLVELRYGIVQRLGQVRTRLKGVERLMVELNSWGPLERLAILHTNAESAARQLLEEVRTKVVVPPLLVNVTTVIGTHVGPNCLGFTAVPLRAQGSHA